MILSNNFNVLTLLTIETYLIVDDTAKKISELCYSKFKLSLFRRLQVTRFLVQIVYDYSNRSSLVYYIFTQLRHGRRWRSLYHYHVQFTLNVFVSAVLRFVISCRKWSCWQINDVIPNCKYKYKFAILLVFLSVLGFYLFSQNNVSVLTLSPSLLLLLFLENIFLRFCFGWSSWKQSIK